MPPSFKIDLQSLSYVLSEQFEKDALEYLLFEPFKFVELQLLHKLRGLSTTLGNAIRYRIGKVLNENLHRFDKIPQLNEWAESELDISEHPNRRLRRYARNIDTRLATGADLRVLVGLPTLAIRGQKSKKSKEVEQNLDALRNLRGDLQSKIVTK